MAAHVKTPGYARRAFHGKSFGPGFDSRRLHFAIGNSLGSSLVLELLAIDRETELEMRTDGERLIIEPVRSGNRAGVKAAAQRAMAAHEATLRKLAK